jgi:hypothetical protein
MQMSPQWKHFDRARLEAGAAPVALFKTSFTQKFRSRLNFNIIYP